MITAPWLAVLFDRVQLADSWREVLLRRGAYYLGFTAAQRWLFWMVARGAERMAATGSGERKDILTR